MRSIGSERRAAWIWAGGAFAITWLACIALGGAAHAQTVGAAAPPAGVEKWEKDIAAFEAKDRESPPPTGGILFVGSSSIRLWKLEKSFPNLPVINRGFGGSRIRDTLHYADRIVIPYKPKTIVFYAGDNDLAQKITPEELAADFKAFVSKVRAALPETKILFLAVKPSVKRASLMATQVKANGLIKEAAASDKYTEFVDVYTPMLGADGQPRADLFIADGLHMNEQGYAVWVKALQPHLAATAESK